jgi:hypothetical protein
MHIQEYWILTDPNFSDEEVEKKIALSDPDDIIKFSFFNDALEYKDYGRECEENDIPRKIRIIHKLVK